MEHLPQPGQMRHPEPEPHEAALERLVDQGVMSYAEAYGRVGEDQLAIAGAAAAPRPRRGVGSHSRPRRAATQGAQYGEETGVGYPDGVPPEHQKWEPMSDEQRKRNKHHIDLIRQQFGW